MNIKKILISAIAVAALSSGAYAQVTSLYGVADPKQYKKGPMTAEDIVKDIVINTLIPTAVLPAPAFMHGRVAAKAIDHLSAKYKEAQADAKIKAAAKVAVAGTAAGALAGAVSYAEPAKKVTLSTVAVPGREGRIMSMFDGVNPYVQKGTDNTLVKKSAPQKAQQEAPAAQKNLSTPAVAGREGRIMSMFDVFNPYVQKEMDKNMGNALSKKLSAAKTEQEAAQRAASSKPLSKMKIDELAAKLAVERKTSIDNYILKGDYEMLANMINVKLITDEYEMAYIMRAVAKKDGAGLTSFGTLKVCKMVQKNHPQNEELVKIAKNYIRKIEGAAPAL